MRVQLEPNRSPESGHAEACHEALIAVAREVVAAWNVSLEAKPDAEIAEMARAALIMAGVDIDE